jgi:nucleoside 2-deoxyribosyltransferase
MGMRVTMHFFMIMPVGSDKQFPAKRRALSVILEERGHSAHFPLEEAFHEELEEHVSFNLRRAVEALEAADLVIADLSFERPSCYYELGLAQALGKRTLLIAQKDSQIHQAAGRQDVQFYEAEDYANFMKVLIESAGA